MGNSREVCCIEQEQAGFSELIEKGINFYLKGMMWLYNISAFKALSSPRVSIYILLLYKYSQYNLCKNFGLGCVQLLQAFVFSIYSILYLYIHITVTIYGIHCYNFTNYLCNKPIIESGCIG